MCEKGTYWARMKKEALVGKDFLWAALVILFKKSPSPCIGAHDLLEGLGISLGIKSNTAENGQPQGFQ